MPDEVELATLAVAAADAVGADFAGVDIVQAADGRLFVLEVNSMPAWSGLQSVVAVNIADAIVGGLSGSSGGAPQDVRASPLSAVSARPIRDMGASREVIRSAYEGLPAGNRGAEARQRPSFSPTGTACRPISSLISARGFLYPADRSRSACRPAHPRSGSSDTTGGRGPTPISASSFSARR